MNEYEKQIKPNCHNIVKKEHFCQTTEGMLAAKIQNSHCIAENAMYEMNYMESH